MKIVMAFIFCEFLVSLYLSEHNAKLNLSYIIFLTPPLNVIINFRL